MSANDDSTDNNTESTYVSEVIAGLAILDPAILCDNTIDLSSEKKLSNKDSDALNREDNETLSKIWAMIVKHPLWMLAGLLGAATFGAIFPIWGLILAKTQTMFYTIDTNKMRADAIMLAIYFIILGVAAFISSGFQFWGVAQVSERVSMRLRSDMFEAVMRREIAYFDMEENSVGVITTRLSDDSRTVTKATGEALAKQLQAIFTLFIGLGIGLSASWKIALVVLATFPVNIAASAIQMQVC